MHAGVTQLVESQPSKLLVAGSSPVSRSKRKNVLSEVLRKATRSKKSERLRSSVGRALPW